MKKRLLTAWIIACLFICLVGQTPLVALADGDDTRVISVPEGLQEVLINETPEVQTVETENTIENSIDIPSEQNEVVAETAETATEQNESVGDINEVPAEQNEVVDETNDIQTEQVVEVESNVDETPIAQTEELTAPGEVVTEIPTVQNKNDDESFEQVTTAPSTDNSVTETKLTATMVASDGNTYEINVSYDNQSGIPMDTELKVDELKPDDEGYDEYIEESASKVGAKAEDIAFSKVFDIKIADKNDENIVYEPTGNVDVSIRVVGVSLDEFENVNVLHFVEDKNEENFLVYDVESTVNEETVEFSTDSFSVYVVIGHEGGTIENPRVMFHFIKECTDNPIGSGSSAYYAVDPYTFKNTHNDPQTTQILKDGDTLELIADPANDSDKYFYGWYVVDPKVIGGTTNDYGVGISNNKLYYTWPANPNRISFEKPISISESGGTISWSLYGVSGSGTADSDGNVHVFLAPLFENYHFVNYMLRPRGESSNNLMTRKLIALGSTTSADVKISDIRSNSTDPVHVVFLGWEYEAEPNVWVSKQTIDYTGEVKNDPGKEGVYMTLDFTGRESIDLYPVFVQARWVDFFSGVSGSGASYVSSRFLRSWGYSGSEHELSKESSADNETYFTSLTKSQRDGYTFDGWYAFAKTDANTGEIINLDDEADVKVTYLTLSGEQLITNTVTVSTKAVKIANGDGTIVTTPGMWGVQDNGNGRGTLTTDGSGNVLFKIVYEEDENHQFKYRLKLYDPLDRLNLCANWAPDDTEITVVYWTENAQDKNYIAPSDPKDDYTPSAVKVVHTADIGASYSSGKTLPLSALKNCTDENSNKIIEREYLDNVGAVLAGEEKFYDLNESLSDASIVIKGDGSSTYNVYFERKTFKLVFHIGHDGYVKNAGQMKNDSYPNWDGNWIEYMYNDDAVTALGYTGKGSKSHLGTFSMTYEGKSYDSTYQTFADNVMGDYVPGTNSNNTENDENLYVIEAKYGAYIGDQWPSPTNTNFQYSSPIVSQNDHKQKTLYIWTAYWDSLYAYNANHRPHNGDNQGNNSDINGIHEYMSAELCTNRSGTGLINENQVHHLVAYFGDANNTERFKRYHYMIEAIDGTYDSNAYQTVQGSDYEDYSRTTWSVNTGADSSTITGKEYYILSDTSVVSNLKPEYQLGWELDGYELVYSCYDPVQHLNSTTSQNEYDIYFFYRPKQYTLTFNLGSTTISDNYYYNESLANANKYTDNVTIPEGYEFRGWYTNAGGVGEQFDFANETMPCQNVVLYPYVKVLQFLVKIDPNGGVLDHRANASVSTYFWADYGTPVGEYTSEKKYIKLSDKELATYTGTKYYYINTQFLGIPEEGDWGYPSILRNAVYVEENNISDYYDEYCDGIANADSSYYTNLSGVGSLQDFIDTYTDYPYRPTDGEHYTFMGWYKVQNGSVSSMPYNFNDPLTGPLELRAMWRLDGGYYIQYNPYYFDEENGTVTAVIGEIDHNAWTDPTDPTLELYADQASTVILNAPTNVTSGWVFRGWRVVRENGTKPFGNDTYINWEPFGDPNYYQPGDPFTIDSNLSTQSNSYGKIIHMQAYYEKDTESVRKPEVTNLILDANDDYLGYISNLHNNQLPELTGPGSQIINDSSELYNGRPTQILIGDIQSNIALHLYRYATTETINGVQGINFFAHDNNYLLIGFDEESDPLNPTTGKAFIPTFASDSVASVTRNETNKILYAMWEPMVYATFVNDTKDDITVNLSGAGNAVSIVNKVTGAFNREQTTTSFVVPKGDSVKVVLPQGAGEVLTATVINKHIHRKMSVSGEFQNSAYGTGSNDIVYYGEVTYNAELQTDEEGIIVTYEDVLDVQLLYDVNGGTWTEPSTDYVHLSNDVYGLDANIAVANNDYEPQNPTKTGKIFLGWTDNTDIAAHTDFSSTDPVTWGNTTITPGENENVLDKVKSDYLWDFSKDPAELYDNEKSLYAVWTDTVTVTFDISYKDNPQLLLHTWTDDSDPNDEPYLYYRSDPDSRYITYTMAKGEKVPKPTDPNPNSDISTWDFYKWMKSANKTSKLRYSNYSSVVDKDDNYRTYEFDFDGRVNDSVTLLTCWTSSQSQTFTFTVHNQVVGVSSEAEFDYTIAVTDDWVCGKLNQYGGINGNGVPDQRWGSVTTKLKNNQDYQVIATVNHLTNFNGVDSVEIKVIDRDGNVIKDGHVFYCGRNTYKNFNADYKYTLLITQDTTANETTVTTDHLTGIMDNLLTDNVNRTFAFETREWRNSANKADFDPEQNNYDNGSWENSIDIYFTNIIYPAPTDYSFDYKPFFMMFGFGAILIGLIVAPVVMLRRRKEEEE